MARAIPAPTRLLAAGLIDWTGTGFYLAISAIFLTRSVGLTPGQVGLALSAVGVAAFAGSVHVGRLGDRHGQRELLLALNVVRAAAFVTLVAVSRRFRSRWRCSRSSASPTRRPAASPRRWRATWSGPRERVAFMARHRTVMNIGITLGTVPAGIVLAGGRRLRRAARGERRQLPRRGGDRRDAAAAAGGPPGAGPPPLLVPSPATAALITVDGLMSMWTVVLNVGLPLWVLQPTSASPALVAVLYATNTVLAVLLQTRVSRRVRTYLRAAQAQRLAGFLLAACCACLAASALGGRELSSVVLLAAVVCLTLAELLKASAAWEITFTLAPAARAAEFYATYGLGRVACQVCGPVLITAVVLALGSPGWLLLAAVFVLGGALTPPMARRARARPVIARTPPGEPPSFAPFAVRVRSA